MKKYDFIIIILINIFVVARILRNSFFHANENIGGIWNFISLYFLLLFFYYYIKKIFIRKKILKGQILLYAYSTYVLITGGIQIFIYNNYALTDIYKILMVPFYIYIFLACYQSKSSIYLISKYFVLLFYIVTILNIISFILYINKWIPFVMISNVYYSLCLFPYILISKSKKKFPFVLMSGCLILSNKRAGVVAFALGTLFYWLLIKKKLTKTTISYVITTIIFISLAYIFLSKNISEIKIFKRMTITQIAKDKGSNRLDIYNTILKSYKELSIEQKLFGTSKENIEKNTGHDNVHNDFLEVLYTKGIIGLCLFLGIYIYWSVILFKMLIKNYALKDTYIFILIINVILSMLSVYFIDFGYSIIGASLTGYLISDFKRKKKEIKDEYKNISNGIWSTKQE